MSSVIRIVARNTRVRPLPCTDSAHCSLALPPRLSLALPALLRIFRLANVFSAGVFCAALLHLGQHRPAHHHRHILLLTLNLLHHRQRGRRPRGSHWWWSWGCGGGWGSGHRDTRGWGIGGNWGRRGQLQCWEGWRRKIVIVWWRRKVVII